MRKKRKRRNENRWGVACAVLAWLPAAAWGLQPLITDDTATQGPAANQIEAAYARTRARAAGAKTITDEAPLVYTRGVTNALDVHAAIARQRISSNPPDSVENGWSNAAIGAKWRFNEDDARKLSFALKPEIRLPVSETREARGLGAARTGYALSVLMTESTAFGAVHANVGAGRVSYADGARDASERRMRYRLSAAPVWNVTQVWRLALDAGIVTNPDRNAKTRMGYVEAAAIYAPGKDLELTVGVIRNVSDGDADTLQGTAGVTLRFR